MQTPFYKVARNGSFNLNFSYTAMFGPQYRYISKIFRGPHLIICVSITFQRVSSKHFISEIIAAKLF